MEFGTSVRFLYFKILAGLLIQYLSVSVAFGQSKKASDSVVVTKQLRPEFSEMVDYRLPVNSQSIHETSGGKAPASNLLNGDGSIKINKSGEIIVPAETFKATEAQKTKRPDSNTAKSKKRKN